MRYPSALRLGSEQRKDARHKEEEEEEEIPTSRPKYVPHELQRGAQSCFCRSEVAHNR